MEHDERRIGGRLGGERGESLVEVARDDASAGRPRRCAAAGSQSGAPVVVFGPDERVEPGEVVGVPHVERVEIDAGAPDDLGQAIGHAAPAP